MAERKKREKEPDVMGRKQPRRKALVERVRNSARQGAAGLGIPGDRSS